MSPAPYFSPEPDPNTVGTFGGYRPPSAPPQDDTPTELAAAGSDDPEQLAAARVTPEQRRAKYEALLQHPNVRAFLNTIANAEGATYDSLAGDSVKNPKKFTDYSQFPSATASGRYQILKPTYDYASRALGVSDFSPHTQDLLATYLIDSKRALEPLLRGDLDAVLPRVAPVWISLPQGKGLGNTHPDQPYKSYDEVKSTFDLNRSP
jgi:muramidase (phage lysozyme)